MPKPFTALILVASLASCLSAPLEGSADAGEDARSSDASLDAKLDANTTLFEAPVFLSELNTSLDERFPVFAASGLSLYFARVEVVGGFEINVPYVARRTSLDEAFGVAVRAAGFGTISISDFEMSDDELEWLYWRSLGQVATSTRPDLDDGWNPPSNLGFDGFSPTLSADGEALVYLALDGKLMRRRRTDRTAPWGTATIVSVDINQPISAVDLSSDGNSLLVTLEAGIYLSSRPSAALPYAAAQLVLAGRFENARFGTGDSLISMTARFVSTEMLVSPRR